MAKLRIIPRDERFFDLFEQAADLAVSGAETLEQLLNNLDDFEQYRTKMSDIEHAGDKVIHETTEKLNRTFITPMDAEDIRAIANRLDDVIDCTHATAERIVLYNVTQAHPQVTAFTTALLQATREVRELLALLRDFSQRKAILQRCIEINRLENVGDNLYREALGKLFRQGDLLELMRWKEIFEQMEHAMNHCEGLADIIELTVIKHS